MRQPVEKGNLETDPRRPPRDDWTRFPEFQRLRSGRQTDTLDTMKTLTTREFFHAPGLVKSLRPGQSLVVTDNGAPAFTVTKAGKRAVKTAGELRREARELFPGERAKVNFTEIIKKLKR